jgi:hypothetical protein
MLGALRQYSLSPLASKSRALGSRITTIPLLRLLVLK